MGMSDKMYIEVGLVMILGIMWLSMPITPSSASTPTSASNAADPLNQPCWTALQRCVNTTLNETTLLDTIQPTFNVSHVFCCSLIQKTVKTDKGCFCGGAIAVSDRSSLYSYSMNTILSTCNVTSPVKALCSGVSGRKIGWTTLLSSLFVISAAFISV